jgi:hypothetical protein
MRNVQVQDNGGAFVALSWEDDAARYHVWVKRDTPRLFKDYIVYKNSHARDFRQPGYFVTRKLSAHAKGNATAIAEARQIAEREGLFTRAAEAFQTAESERQEAQRIAYTRAAWSAVSGNVARLVALRIALRVALGESPDAGSLTDDSRERVREMLRELETI